MEVSEQKMCRENQNVSLNKGDHFIIVLRVCHRATLTALFVIEDTHFKCLGSPTLTSVFKIKVPNMILHRCNRNRIKFSQCPVFFFECKLFHCFVRLDICVCL